MESGGYALDMLTSAIAHYIGRDFMGLSRSLDLYRSLQVAKYTGHGMTGGAASVPRDAFASVSDTEAITAEARVRQAITTEAITIEHAGGGVIIHATCSLLP